MGTRIPDLQTDIMKHENFQYHLGGSEKHHIVSLNIFENTHDTEFDPIARWDLNW